MRWNDEWQSQGLVQRIKYGAYRNAYQKIECISHAWLILTNLHRSFRGYF